MEIENLKVGTWYKSKMQNYFKFKEFKNSYFYSSEEIFNKIWKRDGGWFGGSEGGWTKELTEASLSEIQQYLPDGHVDKINIEKEVLVQTGLNQSEACNTCKYHNDCSKGPHNKTGNEHCPAINGQHYPKQENQIPEYVELLPNFDDKYTGKIFNIKKDSQPLGWGYKSWEWLIQDVHKKYFKPSTKSAYDAQFAKSTLTGSQILNLGDKPVDVTKEWLLAEAKRRYPVGTKYRAIGGGEFISEGQAYFYSKFEHGCSGNINIAVSFPENMRGLVYQDGKWAEIISTPEKKAEIPWTVGGWVRLTKDFKYKGNDYKKGEYHQITAVSKSVNPSVINFKYTDNLGNTLKVEAYTQFSTQTPECEWIGMNQPSWYEEQDRLVTERIKNFNIFIGYNATSDSYEDKQPELFKKNKGTSVEVLPLQKPCVSFYKKSKNNNLIKI